jgi:hypothetical protein
MKMKRVASSRHREERKSHHSFLFCSIKGESERETGEVRDFESEREGWLGKKKF